MPIGQAIKKARETNDITREQLDYAARHIQSIENKGQHPSFQLIIQLVTMLDISVDQYVFPDRKIDKSTLRRRIESLLDTLNDKELSVIEATVIGLCKVVWRVSARLTKHENIVGVLS